MMNAIHVVLLLCHTVQLFTCTYISAIERFCVCLWICVSVCVSVGRSVGAGQLCICLSVCVSVGPLMLVSMSCKQTDRQTGFPILYYNVKKKKNFTTIQFDPLRPTSSQSNCVSFFSHRDREMHLTSAFCLES